MNVFPTGNGEEGGFISIQIDGELVYSGALYYMEMLKGLMDVAHTAALNHDIEQARAVMGVLWTVIQPFDIEKFVNSCVQMGGGTVLDAAKQLCTIWLKADEDAPFELNDETQELADAIFESFNDGMVGLVGRLLPNVHVIDLHPGAGE